VFTGGHFHFRLSDSEPREYGPSSSDGKLSGVATWGLGGRVPPPAYKSRFLRWSNSGEKFF